VLVAADALGQRRRRRRDDRTVGREDQQLERERASRDRVLPPAFVLPGGKPAAPYLGRALEPALDCLALRRRDRLVERRAEGEQGARPLAGRERARDRVVAELHLARVPGVHAELEVRALRDGDAAAPPDRRRRRAPLEPRLDAPAQLDLAGEPLDAARELPPRQLAPVLRRERLGDAHDAVPGAIRRLEHVRALEVSAL